MDQADATFADPFPEPADPWSTGARRRLPLGWLVVAGVCALVFELTSSPALAVVLGCLKFGAGDVIRAHRVKRADPDRARGRVYARFATAWGLWKVTVVATVLMFVLAAVRAGAGPNPALLLEDITAAAVVATSGFLVTSAASAFAVVSALRSGVRIWVGRRRNYAFAVVILALLGAWVVTVFAVTSATLFAAGNGPVARVAILALVVAGGLLFLPVAERIRGRVAAASPEDCWPAPEVFEAVWWR